MSNEYNYDSEAQFFPFFVLTVASLVTLPLTYAIFRAPSDTSTSSQTLRIASPVSLKHADLIDAERAKQKRRELRLKRMLAAAAGWLLIAYMLYLMLSTARHTPRVWNPYDILEVALTASEKDINRRYRNLSTTMHPDKRRPNAALNETAESVNDDWVEIIKAYKALTDEEVRNNYIQYGNPDGKQATSFGIALPHLLVAEGSGKYVLAGYGMLLAVALPWFVGTWWYGMQKLTRDKIFGTSAGSLFREYKERMDEGDMVAAVSCAREFGDVLGDDKAGERPGGVEKKLVAEEDMDTALLPKDRDTINGLDDATRRRALALTWAYLTRLDLGDKIVETEKYALAPTALRINEAFLSICLAYGHTAPVLACYHLSQSLVQAVPPRDRQPLLQLPHVTPTIARQISQRSASATQHSPMTVQSFMALPSEQRRSLAQAAGLAPSNLAVAETVARQLPLLRVEKAFFKVPGERYVIPASLVQFVIKARFIPPGTADVPAVSDDDLRDIDPAEGDLAAQKREAERETFPPPLAHAPYFPRDRSPRWSVFLSDPRQGRIAVPPFTFSAFDRKAFVEAEGKDADKRLRPTFEVVTLKMQFAAPPQPGEYRFTMHLLCDSYVGLDSSKDVALLVEPAEKAQRAEEIMEDDISEPDEDSIAGAMAALKGQPTADAAERAKREAERAQRLKARAERREMQREKIMSQTPEEADEDEDEDYESGTDDADEDVESETDTETDSDEEAAAAEKAKREGRWWSWS